MPINDNDKKLFSFSAKKKDNSEVNSQIKELSKKSWMRVESEYEPDEGIYPELMHNEEDDRLILTMYHKR